MGQEARYYDNKKCEYIPEGVDAVSVTTITGMLAKPALYMFYGKHGITKAKAISKEATDLGSAAHLYADNYFTGNETPIELKSERYFQSVKNFHKFVVICKPKFIDGEKSVYSPSLGYAGTFDCLLEIDGKVVLVDWKTSSALYDEYKLQLHAYYKAALECGAVKHIDEMWAVRLAKDGVFNPKKDVLKLKYDEKCFEAFCGLLSCFNYLKGGKKKRGRK